MFFIRFAVWQDGPKAKAMIVFVLFCYEILTTTAGFSREWIKMASKTSQVSGVDMAFAAVVGLFAAALLGWALTFSIAQLSKSGNSIGLFICVAVSSIFSTFAFKDVVVDIDYSAMKITDYLAWVWLIANGVGPLALMTVNAKTILQDYGPQLTQLIEAEKASIKQAIEKLSKDRYEAMRVRAELADKERDIKRKIRDLKATQRHKRLDMQFKQLQAQ